MWAIHLSNVGLECYNLPHLPLFKSLMSSLRSHHAVFYYHVALLGCSDSIFNNLGKALATYTL